VVVIENMPPPQPRPALVAPAPAPASAGGIDREYEVVLPDRIPAHCIQDSSATYQVNPLLMLAVLKVESNGRPGIVAQNTNGSFDLGPSQFNSRSWAKLLIEKYKIPREALVHDMCQAVRALGFALRTEINDAGGDLWKGIGNYHSRNLKHHVKYVGLVYGAYKQMTMKGKF
jgi:hypothetical protein